MSANRESQPMPPESVVKDGRIDRQIRNDLINVDDKEFEERIADVGEFDDLDKANVEGLSPEAILTLRRERDDAMYEAEDVAEDAAWDLDLDDDQEEELRLIYTKMILDKKIRDAVSDPDRNVTINDFMVERAKRIVHMTDEDFKDFMQRWNDDAAITFARQYREAENQAHLEDEVVNRDRKVREEMYQQAHADAIAQDEMHNAERDVDLHSGKYTFEEFKAKYPYLAYKYVNRADSPYGRPADARPEHPWVTHVGATLDRTMPDGTRFVWEVVSADGNNVVARRTVVLPGGRVHRYRPQPVGSPERFLYDINHPQEVAERDRAAAASRADVTQPADQPEAEPAAPERRRRLRNMVMGSFAVRIVTQISNELRGRGGDVFLNEPIVLPAEPQPRATRVRVNIGPEAPVNGQAPATPEANGGNNPWDQLGITEQVWARNEHTFYEQFKDDFQADENGDVHPIRPVENMTAGAKAFIDRLRQGGR